MSHTGEFVGVSQIVGIDFAAHLLTFGTFLCWLVYLGINVYSFIAHFDMMNRKKGLRWKRYLDHISAELLLEI